MEAKGYSFELAGQEVSEFRCNICKLLLREATELPCTHMFCQACLWEWHMDPKSKAGKSLDEQTDFYECPDCHQSYFIEQIRRSAVTDKVITASLMIKCHFSKHGCSWTGHIVQFQEHKLECDFTPSNCPFQGCYKVLNRGQLEEHKENCQYRFATCKECGKNYESKKGHSCTIECPNNGCSVQVPEDKMAAHRERCLKELVSCGSFMCNASRPGKLKREELLKHCINCSDAKMIMLMKKDEYNERRWKIRKTIGEARDILNQRVSDMEKYEREVEDLTPKLEKIRKLQDTKKNGDQPASLPVENFQGHFEDQGILTSKLISGPISVDDIMELVETINKHRNVKPKISDLINHSIMSRSNKCLAFVLTRYKSEITEKDMKRYWSKALICNLHGIHPSIPILLQFHPNLLNAKAGTNKHSGSALNIAMFSHLPELFKYLINQPGIDLELLEFEKFEKESRKQINEFKQILKHKKKIFKEEGGLFGFLKH
ncbi:TNF receptor-associated factor family protein DDB_G0268444-like [Clytia hemisphaerica]|uniref:Uncharacterized protein n=1 Tax=Clytia hemisphaerica TaxID=252671 RepID=A0A7M5X4M3_9CNID